MFQHVINNFYILILVAFKTSLLAGAGLEGLVEEAAGLLVALVDLEAFVEHLLVLGAGFVLKETVTSKGSSVV